MDRKADRLVEEMWTCRPYNIEQVGKPNNSGQLGRFHSNRQIGRPYSNGQVSRPFSCGQEDKLHILGHFCRSFSGGLGKTGRKVMDR